MLDVFVGIGFVSLLIMFTVVRAIRLNRTEPWFVPFRPRDKGQAASQAPWRRKQ